MILECNKDMQDFPLLAEHRSRGSLLCTTRHNFDSTLQEFAGDNLNVAEMMMSFSDRVKNIEGKGENVHFLLFSQCFQKNSSF